MRWSQGFFIEGKRIQIAGGNPSLAQAIPDGRVGKGAVVLDEAEALFLSSRYDGVVGGESSRAVVIKSRNSNGGLKESIRQLAAPLPVCAGLVDAFNSL